MKIARLSVFLALPILLAGCRTASVAVPPPPGAVNSVDETLYQSLSAAQAALNSLKASEPTVPQIKTALNAAIADYDTAEIAYQTFHAALVAGQNPSSSSVQAAINKVQTDIAAIGGTK